VLSLLLRTEQPRGRDAEHLRARSVHLRLLGQAEDGRQRGGGVPRTLLERQPEQHDREHAAQHWQRCCSAVVQIFDFLLGMFQF